MLESQSFHHPSPPYQFNRPWSSLDREFLFIQLLCILCKQVDSKIYCRVKVTGEISKKKKNHVIFCVIS